MKEYKFKLTNKYYQGKNGIYYEDWDKDTFETVGHITSDSIGFTNTFKSGRYMVRIGIRKDGELYFDDFRKNLKGKKKVNSEDVENILVQWTVWLSQMIQKGYLLVEET